MVKVKELSETKLYRWKISAGLLLTGTPGERQGLLQESIHTVGKGGGFMMSWGTSLDEADGLHARVIDFTKEYGVY